MDKVLVESELPWRATFEVVDYVPDEQGWQFSLRRPAERKDATLGSLYFPPDNLEVLLSREDVGRILLEWEDKFIWTGVFTSARWLSLSFSEYRQEQTLLLFQQDDWVEHGHPEGVFQEFAEGMVRSVTIEPKSSDKDVKSWRASYLIDVVHVESSHLRLHLCLSLAYKDLDIVDSLMAKVSEHPYYIDHFYGRIGLNKAETSIRGYPCPGSFQKLSL